MGRVVAIGDHPDLAGFGLVGVSVLPLNSVDAIDSVGWELDDDVALVILTPAAMSALEGVLTDRPDLLIAVVP